MPPGKPLSPAKVRALGGGQCRMDGGGGRGWVPATALRSNGAPGAVLCPTNLPFLSYSLREKGLQGPGEGAPPTQEELLIYTVQTEAFGGHENASPRFPLINSQTSPCALKSIITFALRLCFPMATRSQCLSVAETLNRPVPVRCWPSL